MYLKLDSGLYKLAMKKCRDMIKKAEEIYLAKNNKKVFQDYAISSAIP